jgi:anthraniloyl-CoA monooxygenase
VSAPTSLSRIDVVGGGPGGAFAARLLKRQHPGAQVHLYDPLPPEDTFGFGVGLSPSTQQNLAEHDPETFALIRAESHSGHGMSMHSGGTAERVPGHGQVAVARSRLLQVLYAQAARAGVRLHPGERVDALSREADLVVAADGVGSPTRAAAAEAFGAVVTTGRQRFIWCGVDAALPDALFAPADSEAGVLTTHAYPYAADRSTFLIETSEEVWRASGSDRDVTDLAPGASDEEALEFLQGVFKEHLGGASLLGNNSRWTRFRTVHCERWHHGNVVLLGDAAHTAHYSVGSGTKLAMEDAIALTHAVRDRPGDLPAAFEAYQAARQPAVEQLQYLAHRSELWWESYVDRLALSPAQMLVSFFSRAGNVALDRLQQREPDLVRRALVAYGGAEPHGDAVEWVLRRPLTRGRYDLPDRVLREPGPDLLRVECDLEDPRAPGTRRYLDGLVTQVRARGADGVELVGPSTPDHVRRRLDVAEQLTWRAPCLIAVRAPLAMRPDLASSLVARRIDLVSFEEE